MDQKRVNPNFLELWGFVLMSQMILEEKETFFSKNVAQNRIFCLGESDPFVAPLGTPRGTGVFFLDWY